MRAGRRVDQLADDSRRCARCQSSNCTMTNRHGSREIAVMISSTTPLTKYSCSGPPLRFWNGSTANDGLSGKANGGFTEAANRGGVA
jgi:hypothetical protein